MIYLLMLSIILNFLRLSTYNHKFTILFFYEPLYYADTRYYSSVTDIVIFGSDFVILELELMMKKGHNFDMISSITSGSLFCNLFLDCKF